MDVDYKQLDHLHPTLKEVLSFMEDEIGFKFINTSNYRPGDSGVHGTIPLRGWDLRCRVKSIGYAVCNFVNEHWRYDPERPNLRVAYAHGEGPNFHIHVQVHPNTVKL